MGYTKLLILLFLAGISSDNYCEIKENYVYPLGYNLWNYNLITSRIGQKYLHCKHLEGNRTPSFKNFTHNRPKLIGIDHSHIEKLTSSYFGHIDTSEVEYLGIRGSTIDSIEGDAFKGLNGTLKSIYIGFTDISNISQSAFNNLNIVTLWLGFNDLSTFEEGFLRGTKSLKHLDLKSNNFEDVSVILEDCQWIEHLNLHENAIAEFPDFSNCTHLLYLEISKNKIQNFTSKSFKNINLKILDLSLNKITNISAYDLRELHKLELLRLHDNPLFETLPAHLFQHNSALIRLDLHSAGLKKVEVGAFFGLENLLDLNLSKNKFYSIRSANVFDGLSNLTWLNLNDNELEYLANDSFTVLVSLEYLHLQGNKLRSINFDLLPINLKIIDLHGNHINCNEIFATSEPIKSILEEETYGKITTKGLRSCNGNYLMDDWDNASTTPNPVKLFLLILWVTLMLIL